MLVVGLTGGIGSGKSAVAKLFAEHDVPIIDADDISRELTQADQPAFHSIIKHFGNQVILPDGKLDRAKLRDIIFRDPKQRLWLEHLLHPMIRDAIAERLKQIHEPYCILVIPLLLEVEFYSFINRILVVDAPEQKQLERVAARDNSRKSEIEAILKTQASREARLARAHDVITNNGTLDDLVPQVEQLHEKYSQMANSHSR